MEDKLTLSTLYRAQSVVDGRTFQTLPMKRVSLSDAQGLIFNPDHTRYIYFSPSSVHHAYYINKKLIDTVNYFLDKYGKRVKRLVSRDFDNLQIVKTALSELGDLRKEVKVESIALEYLAVFKKMIDDCAIKQGMSQSDKKCIYQRFQTQKNMAEASGLQNHGWICSKTQRCL